MPKSPSYRGAAAGVVIATLLALVGAFHLLFRGDTERVPPAGPSDTVRAMELGAGGMPRSQSPDGDPGVMRMPVTAEPGGALFEVRLAAGFDRESVAVHAVNEGEDPSSLAPRSPVGLASVAKPLVIAAEDWERLVNRFVKPPEFYAVLQGAVLSFTEQEERRYVCSFPVPHQVQITFRTRGGVGVPGVRVALSQRPISSSEMARRAEDHALARLEDRAFAVHHGASGEDGVVSLQVHDAGLYCFEFMATGHDRIGGADPETHRIEVPGPTVAVELGPVAVAAVDIDAEEVLTFEMETKLPGGVHKPSGSRSLNRHIQRYVESYTSIDVADAVVLEEDATVPAASVSALLRKGDEVGHVTGAVPFKILKEPASPTILSLANGTMVASGELSVLLQDNQAHLYEGVKYALAPVDVDVMRGALKDREIVGRTGSALRIPAGTYSLRFVDKVMHALAGRSQVQVPAGGDKIVTTQLPEVLCRFKVVLDPRHARLRPGGVAIRVKTDGGRATVMGGDGNLEFGPFWSRQSFVEVDVSAIGFQTEPVVTQVSGYPDGPVQVIRIPLEPEF